MAYVVHFTKNLWDHTLDDKISVGLIYFFLFIRSCYTLHKRRQLSSRWACLLDSGGTIWLLWVYWDPVGIKIDSVGTSRRKWPALSNNVVFLAWFHENNVMAFPKLYPIEWCMHHFTSRHTNTWNTVSILMFLGVHKIWSAWRGIKTEPISLRLCTYQLYFNAWHYSPCSNLSMSTKTTLIEWWQTRNWPHEFRLTSLLIRWFCGYMAKDSVWYLYSSHEREPLWWLCFI